MSRFEYQQEISLQQAKTLFTQRIVWLDLEIHPQDQHLIEGGLCCVIDCVFWLKFSQNDLPLVMQILADAQIIAGHNILAFDYKWLSQQSNNIDFVAWKRKTLDTLLLANLLIPYKPSHALLKLYKTQNSENDPIADCLESYQLYQELVNIWQNLHPILQLYITEKLPFSNLLPDMQIREAEQDYFKDCLPQQGDYQALIEYLDALPNNKIENLGALTFTHWLSHLDQPFCRRPVWLADFSDYKKSFIEAEKSYWKNKALNQIDFNQESQEFFGFELRAGQHKIIQAIANDDFVPLGLLPTGGGKSLTFQLPALVLSKYRRDLTVIISPLKALMEDQVLGLQQHERLGFWAKRAACLISGQSAKEQADILEGIWSGEIDLVYISPERLRSSALQRLLSQRRPGLWVMDEAHTISQWGSDFRPDFLRIGRLIASCYQKNSLEQQSEYTVQPPRIMLVTATASPRVINEIREEIFQPLKGLLPQQDLQVVSVQQRQTVWRDEIQVEFIKKAKDERLADIMRILRDIFPHAQQQIEIQRHQPHPIVLIYVRNRDKTEEFSEKLNQQGFKTMAYHGKMSASDKKEVLEQFKQHQLDIVVCTNAFGMGIDRAAIHTVIHYSPPNNLESYLQEIGRAARKQGEIGHAVLFWNERDIEKLFEHDLKSRIRGYQALQQCWQNVILPALKRDPSERWFTAQELQPILDVEGEDLATQARVVLLALERHRLLLEKEHLPALISIRLIKAPQSSTGQSTELYHRLAAVLSQQHNQLYLPEISLVLGMNVRKLLTGVRRLVKMGCITWKCQVRVRLKNAHQYIRVNLLNKKRREIDVLVELWAAYPPSDDLIIRYQELNQWLVQNQKQVNAKEIFYTLKYLKVLNLRENKRSFKLLPIYDENWTDWLVTARKNLNCFEQSLNILLDHTKDAKDNKERESLTQQLDIDELAEQYQFEPEDFLLHLEQMQSFGWLSVSRLDDDSQKIFFIDEYRGVDKRERLTESAFEYLQQHYIDRNRRLHILAHWLKIDLEQKKVLLDDYFNIDVKTICEKYLPDAKLAEQSHLVDYQAKIFPPYLSDIQKEIIKDDKRRAMLVLAGPGSGKTTIIVHRVANLVALKDVAPHKILVLAYNRQAVFEIRKRLAQLLNSELAAQIQIFTFHALARHLTGLNEKQAPEDCQDEFQWLLQQAILQLTQEAKFYNYILVDEFQDIDDDQYQIIAHLAGLRESDEGGKEQKAYLCVVGDDDQNLYGFRGARIEHIQNFQNEYQISHDDVLYLVENYRCPSDIVTLANDYIEHTIPAHLRLKDQQHTIYSNKKEKNNIYFRQYQQLHAIDAIVWLIEQIKQLQQIEFKDWSEFAIITRTWDELKAVQHYLLQANLPFQLLNCKSSIQSCDSMIIKALLNDLSQRPDLDLIQGSVQQFLQDWQIKQQWSAEDQSWQLMYQQMQNIENITIEQLCQRIYTIKDYQRDKIILSTFHSVKGCEYSYVFIIDSCQFCPKIEKYNQARSMYVALTRAKQKIFILQRKIAKDEKQPLKDSLGRLYKQKLVNFEMVAEQKLPLYFEYFIQLGYADIHLSNRMFILSESRENIKNFARNIKINHLTVKQNKYYTSYYWTLNDENQGSVSRLSNGYGRLLNQFVERKVCIQCSAVTVVEFFQGNRQKYYVEQGYTGDETSHFVVIPQLKIIEPTCD